MIPANFRRSIGISVIFCSFLATTILFASPKIWVAVRSEVIFDGDRRAIAVRHVWEFDEFYSSTVTGLLSGNSDDTRDLQIQAAPPEALKGLARREFFTLIRVGEKRLSFKSPHDVEIEKDIKNIIRLRFTLPFEAPAVLDRPLLLDIRDPDHGIAFGLEMANPVTMTGNHTGCSAQVIEPETFIAAYSKQPPTSVMVTCR